MAKGYGDYRAVGIHTNHPGGKMKREPMDRFGKRIRDAIHNPAGPMAGPLAAKPRNPAIGEAIAATNERYNKIPGPSVPAGGMVGHMGAKASEANKLVPQKGPTMQQRVGAAANAANEMSGLMAADQERFSAEHDRAVAEGGAMAAGMRQSMPGRAQDIIAKKRV